MDNKTNKPNAKKINVMIPPAQPQPPISPLSPNSTLSPPPTKSPNYFLIFILAAVGIIIIGIFAAILVFYKPAAGNKPRPAVFITPTPTPKLSLVAPTLDSRLEAAVEAYETLPENAVLKSTIGNIPIYQTPDRPLSDADTTILKQILEGIPPEILAIQPKAIISTAKDTQAGYLKFNPLLAAFARGPYIFVLDQTFTGPKMFNPENKALNIGNIRRTIIHEFIHIAQYYDTPKTKLAKTQALFFAPMVKNYAQTMGWVDTLESEDLHYWQLTDQEAVANWYSKTNPVEDQAESIAFFVTGHLEEIDQKRVDWIANWLDKAPQTYSQGVVPRFLESQNLRVEAKYFPEAKVNQYQQEFPFVETFGWQTTYNQDSPNNPTKLSAYYSQVLPERGWQGNLVKKGSSWEGEFTSLDRKKAYIMILPAFAGTLTNILVLEGSK